MFFVSTSTIIIFALIMATAMVMPLCRKINIYSSIIIIPLFSDFVKSFFNFFAFLFRFFKDFHRARPPFLALSAFCFHVWYFPHFHYFGNISLNNTISLSEKNGGWLCKTQK